MITTLETRERLVEMGSFLMHADLYIQVKRDVPNRQCNKVAPHFPLSPCLGSATLDKPATLELLRSIWGTPKELPLSTGSSKMRQRCGLATMELITSWCWEEPLGISSARMKPVGVPSCCNSRSLPVWLLWCWRRCHGKLQFKKLCLIPLPSILLLILLSKNGCTR